MSNDELLHDADPTVEASHGTNGNGTYPAPARSICPSCSSADTYAVGDYGLVCNQCLTFTATRDLTGDERERAELQAARESNQRHREADEKKRKAERLPALVARLESLSETEYELQREEIAKSEHVRAEFLDRMRAQANRSKRQPPKSSRPDSNGTKHPGALAPEVLAEVSYDTDGFTSFDDPKRSVIEAVKAGLQRTERDKIQRSKTNRYRVARIDPYVDGSLKLDRAAMEPVHSQRYLNGDEYGVALKKHYAEAYNLPLSEAEVKDVVIDVSYRHQFNSLTKMLRQLPPTSANPLREILRYIRFKETTIEVDGQKYSAGSAGIYTEIFDLFFKKMVLKLHAIDLTWIEYPNDVVIILEGPQGIGKSLCARYLALGDLRYFVELGAENHVDLISRDGLLLLVRKLIGELGELNGLRKAEIEAIKSFISKTHDEYRPPYGRGIVRVPRTISFIGTTNETEYLIDATGNRRFFPVCVESFDFALFQRIDLVQQLYSWYSEWALETLSGSHEEIQGRLLALNELSPLLEKYLEDIRAEKRIQSPYEGLIQRYIDRVVEGDFMAINRGTDHPDLRAKFFNATECGLYIFRYPGQIPRDFPKFFGAAMREAGYVLHNRRIAGKRMRIWEAPEPGTRGTGGTGESIHAINSVGINTYIGDGGNTRSCVPSVPNDPDASEGRDEL